MVYVFLADGFEEMEALAPIDIMRRAGINVVTVGITGEFVTGAHDIIVKADTTAFTMSKEVELIVLPGGGKGTANLAASQAVKDAIAYSMSNGVKMAAICAAPSVLGENGALVGKKATCFPLDEFISKLVGAEYVGNTVCVDGDVITARSAGYAAAFGIELVAQLRGTEASEQKYYEIYQTNSPKSSNG